MSGTGMEQARQVMRGARRREGEKPCGRNVTGKGGMLPELGGSSWLAKRCRGQKPRKERRVGEVAVTLPVSIFARLHR
mgnify:CR=1 FL=1